VVASSKNKFRDRWDNGQEGIYFSRSLQLLLPPARAPAGAFATQDAAGIAAPPRANPNNPAALTEVGVEGENEYSESDDSEDR
jgi:hypothetical protein